MGMAKAATIALLALPLGAPADSPPPLVLRTGETALGIYPADVVSVSLSAREGAPLIRVTVNEPARSALADLTRAALGSEVEIRFCGRLLMRPRLLSVLDEGRFTLGGALGDEGLVIVAILEGREACAAQAS